MAVMSVYSASEHRQSVMAEHDVKIRISGGLKTKEKDWYPLMMTFNPLSSSFSRRLGREASVSIMYSFGAFEYGKGASLYYNPNSDYFSSFYGAYVIEDKNQAFGFYADGSLNTDELSLVPDYDMRILVLKSIGCEAPFFDYEVASVEEVDEFIGYKDWFVMDSIIYTNSPVHEVTDKHQAYIQYGKPSYEGDTDFEPITLYGRVYAKYFETEDLTICFYVIGANEDTINNTDLMFLQEAELEFN
jgi:hypothetical protein